MLQRLPLGTSSFREIRGNKDLYVDKTQHAYDLITGTRRYFLSRPRRFGKSLLVSMMKEVLLGNKVLFDGLWIAHSDYQWQPHGVISLDFSTLAIGSIDKLEKSLCLTLSEIAQDYGLDIPVDQEMPSQALRSVTRALHKKFGHVAVLIDEYDRPIVHSLKNREHAEKVLDTVKDFFANIKGLGEYINFVFITGVSAFAKAGIFSGINNLQVITLTDKFSGICGYTDQEVDHYFSNYIQAWASKKNMPYDDLRAQIKEWYNGYHFGADVPAVYNPFSLMNALAAQAFKSFWIQSGTPTFLIEQLKKYYSQHGDIVLDFEGLEVSERILQSFDINEIPLPALMFQAGYITISGYDKINDLYSLETPNKEVEIAVKGYLLETFTNLHVSRVHEISDKLRRELNDGNVAGVVYAFRQLFSSVPYQIHLKDEKFYHGLLQIACTAAGVKVQSEYSTSHGRIDVVVTTHNIVYIVELKFNQNPEIALLQIKDRRYYEQFLNLGKSIVLLGLSFTKAPKNFDMTYAFERIDA